MMLPNDITNCQCLVDTLTLRTVKDRASNLSIISNYMHKSYVGLAY
jgi:hypothetical protein